MLAQHFCQKFGRAGHVPTVAPDAMELLMSAPWPGNVRQLENAIERACVTAKDGVIGVKNLPPDISKRAGATDAAKHPFQVDLARTLPDQLKEITSAFEERYLRKAMRKTRGHVGKCATISGLSRRSITDKIAEYKIEKDDFKKD